MAAPPPHGHLTPLPPRLELHRRDLIQPLGPPGRWAGVEGRGEGVAWPLQKQPLHFEPLGETEARQLLRQRMQPPTLPLPVAMFVRKVSD